MSPASITTPAATTTTIPTSARLGMMLTDLRLPTIKRLAGDLCTQSDNEGWPAHRLLEALLEHEINEREARRINRHRVESNLSPDKRLSSFDFSAVPSVSKAQVMALAEGTEWVERGANVLLFGPPGVGKSHLVSALGHALIDAGRRVLFARCSDLVQRLQVEHTLSVKYLYYLRTTKTFHFIEWDLFIILLASQTLLEPSNTRNYMMTE